MPRVSLNMALVAPDGAASPAPQQPSSPAPLNAERQQPTEETDETSSENENEMDVDGPPPSNEGRVPIDRDAMLQAIQQRQAAAELEQAASLQRPDVTGDTSIPVDRQAVLDAIRHREQSTTALQASSTSPLVPSKKPLKQIRSLKDLCTTQVTQLLLSPHKSSSAPSGSRVDPEREVVPTLNMAGIPASVTQAVMRELKEHKQLDRNTVKLLSRRYE